MYKFHNQFDPIMCASHITKVLLVMAHSVHNGIESLSKRLIGRDVRSAREKTWLVAERKQMRKRALVLY